MASRDSADVFPASTRQKMPRKMYNHFDFSSLQSVWRQIVSVVDIGGPNLCPIPFIEKPHYFDLLNVFVKMKKTPKQRIKGIVTDNNKYQFVAKLNDVITFTPDKNKERIARIVQLNDRTPASELALVDDPYARPVTHIIEGERKKYVQRAHEFRINNPRLHALHFEMDGSIKVGIDRKKPGFERAKYLLIVSEVYSCKRASVASFNGNNVNVERYFLDEGPIPLAFAVLRVELDEQGTFQKMERCHPRRFFEESHWSNSAVAEPKESEVIKSLSVATILPSTKHTIPNKIPEDMDTNVYQNVWRQIVKDMEIAGPALCPVPYIDKAHYFDLLNIFVELDEPILDAVKSTLTKNKKYKYVGKWRNLVVFLTDNTDRINDIVQLRDQTPLTRSDKSIEHNLSGKQADVERDYKLHIDNPKIHALHFKMDPRIAVGVDRTKPGLEVATSLLVIAEVFSGSNVSVQFGEGGQEDEQRADAYVPLNDPIPLAFGALRMKLEANGIFKSPPHIVSCGELGGLKRWIFTEGRIPKESEVIKTLTAGMIYNLGNKHKNNYDVDEQQPTNSGLNHDGGNRPKKNNDVDYQQTTNPGLHHGGSNKHKKSYHIDEQELANQGLNYDVGNNRKKRYDIDDQQPTSTNRLTAEDDAWIADLLNDSSYKKKKSKKHKNHRCKDRLDNY